MRSTWGVFVNTSDGFADCWEPYFKLFSKYWPNFEGSIYLNTEKMDYCFPNLNIIALKVLKDFKNNKKSWSHCLLAAIDLIEEDIVLQTFEDCFLIDYVNHTEIAKLVNIMIKEDLTFIGLGGNNGPYFKTEYTGLLGVEKGDPYRINTQPSLWNIRKIKKFIKKHESPWFFEVYGSERTKYFHDKIYAIDEDYYGGEFTLFPNLEGLRRGKWEKNGIVDIFRNNNIDIDYSIRGFYGEPEKKPNFIKRITVKHVCHKLLTKSQIYAYKFKAIWQKK
jgi:hypothetical protein